MSRLEAYPNQKLYRVRKIFDGRENKAIDETRMCGQAAIPYVPTEKYRAMLETRKVDRKGFDKWASEASFADVWQRQETLEPIIGYPVYFSSVKMDAGYYRSATVEKIEQDGRTGDITLHVASGSKILIREDD